MADIVERLRRKVFRGPTMEATHTKTVEWQAADEIERLRAALGLFACDCIESGNLCPSPQNCRNYIARDALEEGRT